MIAGDWRTASGERTARTASFWRTTRIKTVTLCPDQHKKILQLNNYKSISISIFILGVSG
jgi:hypothetical protein